MTRLGFPASVIRTMASTPGIFLAATLSALCLTCALAESGREEAPPSARSVIFYSGKYTDTDLLPILFSQRTAYRDNWISMVGASQRIAEPAPLLVEAEFLAGRHFGHEQHYEADTAIFAHYSIVPTPFRLGAAEGLSLASENPPMENHAFDPTRWPPVRHSQKSSVFLNYLAFEIDSALPALFGSTRVFVRVHHRSGVFGLLCPPTCGSNYVSYGMRYGF